MSTTNGGRSADGARIGALSQCSSAGGGPRRASRERWWHPKDWSVSCGPSGRSRAVALEDPAETSRRARHRARRLGGGRPASTQEEPCSTRAAVYAIPRGGTQLRIGTVQPGRTDTLTVRSGSVPPGTSVTLVARLLASRQVPTSGPLTLQPGDRIGVTLPPEANILNVLPAP